MPKLSELIPLMAETLAVPENTVGVIARHARAAGAISSAGRGPGGAEMTATDCANLLIAVLGCHIGGQAKDAGNIIQVNRDAWTATTTENEASILRFLGIDAFTVQFGTVLDRMIEVFNNRLQFPYGSVLIEMTQESLKILLNQRGTNKWKPLSFSIQGDGMHGDLFIRATVTHFTVFRLGNFIIGEKT